jgi:hypothetical protein
MNIRRFKNSLFTGYYWTSCETTNQKPVATKKDKEANAMGRYLSNDLTVCDFIKEFQSSRLKDEYHSQWRSSKTRTGYANYIILHQHHPLLLFSKKCLLIPRGLQQPMKEKTLGQLIPTKITIIKPWNRLSFALGWNQDQKDRLQLCLGILLLYHEVLLDFSSTREQCMLIKNKEGGNDTRPWG